MRNAAVFLLLLGSAWPAVAGQRVPAVLVGLPDAVTTAYVAETSTSTLHRFERRGDDIVLAGADFMSIGLGGAGKYRSGDQRTPLGAYFVTERLDTSRLHEKYGPLAFPLDYPNAWDRRHGRTGDGIWIHGMDERAGRRPARDTDGCLALPNERLLDLAETFRPNLTPVVIVRALEWAEPGDILALRAALEGAIEAWAANLEQGDMYAWLALYDETFRRWDMDRSDWIAFSMQTLAGRPIAAVSVSELTLLAVPEEPGLYLGRFRLRVTESGAGARTVNSMRRLYWRRTTQGDFRIVAEGAG